MNRPITLCDRCKEYARCCLNYDGDICRRIRTIEPTKADRIRSMTDEELAKFFADYVSCHDCPIPYCKVRFTMERLGCQANWLDWLKQEAE